MNEFVKIKTYAVTREGNEVLISVGKIASENTAKVDSEGVWMDDLVDIFAGETCVQSSDLVAKCAAFWNVSAPTVYKRLKYVDVVKTRVGNAIWYEFGESVEIEKEVFDEETGYSAKQIRMLDAYNEAYGKELTVTDDEGMRVLDGEWNEVSVLAMSDSPFDSGEGVDDFGEVDDSDVDAAVNALLEGDAGE